MMHKINIWLIDEIRSDFDDYLELLEYLDMFHITAITGNEPYTNILATLDILYSDIDWYTKAKDTLSNLHLSNLHLSNLHLMNEDLMNRLGKFVNYLYSYSYDEWIINT